MIIYLAGFFGYLSLFAFGFGSWQGGLLLLFFAFLMVRTDEEAWYYITKTGEDSE